MNTTDRKWQTSVERGEQGQFVKIEGQDKGKAIKLTAWSEDDKLLRSLASDKGVTNGEMARFLVNFALSQSNIIEAIAAWDGQSKPEDRDKKDKQDPQPTTGEEE
ncbi:MAG: hypothetical protein J7647_10410 [Cyanobacteria bacterium SBLK]|nr:hypothetical protein [Cyanobacteria bacterium SBLK]